MAATRLLPQPTRERRLPVEATSRRGRDPGRNGVRRLSRAFDLCGLSLPAAFAQAAAEAHRLDAEAVAAARDGDRSPEDRKHQAARLRAEAGRARAEAVAAIDPEALENSLRGVIEQAVRVIERAGLPAAVTTAEQAVAAGPKVAAAWAAVRQADQQAASAWALGDFCREAGVLPPTLGRSERLWHPWPGDTLLGRPGQGGAGYAVPQAHRFGEPLAVGARATLSAALQAGAQPGLHTAQQARAKVLELLAAIEDQADRQRAAARGGA